MATAVKTEGRSAGKEGDVRLLLTDSRAAEQAQDLDLNRVSSLAQQCLIRLLDDMENKYDEIFKFLSMGEYPSEYNKSQRFHLKKQASEFSIKGGELFFGSRRAIKSKEEAKDLFTELHLAPMGGHTGIIKTRRSLCSRFYWRGMTIDIENWILECDKCQKVGRPLAAAQSLQFIQVSAVWELVGIDLTGPLPKTKNDYQYILTATDYFSKWVEAFPLKTKSAVEVAQRLCSIIYRHGCPQRLLSDQGREFVNQVNNSMCELLKIQRSVTAAYHPQTNGLDEKTNHNIKRALCKLVNDQQNDWDVYLDATLFSLRSKMQTTTKHSPFLLMYGREAVFPCEVPVDLPLKSIILPDENSYATFVKDKQSAMDKVKKTTKENIAMSQQKQKIAHEKKVQKKYKHLSYNVGDEVLLFNARKHGRKGGRMESDFLGPYIIQSITGKLVTLTNSEGVTLKTKYNVDHLKPYRRSVNSTVQSPEGHDSKSVEQINTHVPCVPQTPSVNDIDTREKDVTIELQMCGLLQMTAQW